jgi:hypothetical protein
MSEFSGAGGPYQSENVVQFTGVRLASTASVRPADPDLVLACAGKLAGLALHVGAVRTALEGSNCPLPSGLLEWLAAIEGQIDTRAASVEEAALFAQGAGDVA